MGSEEGGKGEEELGREREVARERECDILPLGHMSIHSQSSDHPNIPNTRDNTSQRVRPILE